MSGKKKATPNLIINTPKQNVVNVLSGKKVLFIENDSSLENGLEYLEMVIKDNDIEYKKIFKASLKPLATIIDNINEYDAIVFMTQWLTETSKILTEYVRSLQTKKTVIQVYINEPTWYYASQHGSIHDVYIYQNMDGKYENFYKLTDKAYWDYENKFDH